MRIKPRSRVQEEWPPVGGLTYSIATEIKPCAPPDLRSVSDPIMRAIRTRFPKSHASYHGMIFRRYTEFYKNLPADDAVKAIQRGFSSPDAAMSARVIRRRPYVGIE